MEAVPALLTPADLVEWLLLCILCAAAVHATHTDLQSGVVRNYCSLGLLAAGLVGQSFLCALGRTPWTHWGGLVAVSLAVTVLLYLRGVWSPGDAKLYLGMAVAFPAALAPTGRVLSVETGPIALLLHSFVLYFVASLVVALRHAGAERRGKGSAWSIGARQLVAAGAAAGIVLIGVGGVMGQVVGYGSALLLTLGVALLLGPVVATPWGTGLCIALAAGGVYAAVQSQGLAMHLGLSVSSGLAMLGHELLRARGGLGVTRSVEVSAVAAGLVPAMALVPQGSGTAAYRLSERATRGALCQPNNPLTASQARRIRALGAPGRADGGVTALPVVGVLPFAPFLAAGLIMTVLCAGSVIGVLVPEAGGAG